MDGIKFTDYRSERVKSDDGLVYCICMEDKLFGLRMQLRVFKTWEDADKQARETAKEQSKACWVMGFPDPRNATL